MDDMELSKCPTQFRNVSFRFNSAEPVVLVFYFFFFKSRLSLRWKCFSGQLDVTDVFGSGTENMCLITLTTLWSAIVCRPAIRTRFRSTLRTCEYRPEEIKNKKGEAQTTTPMNGNNRNSFNENYNKVGTYLRIQISGAAAEISDRTG